jgi:hypothetical protein
MPSAQPVRELGEVVRLKATALIKLETRAPRPLGSLPRPKLRLWTSDETAFVNTVDSHHSTC